MRYRLIATHPPYANIILYSMRKSILGELSAVHSLEEYIMGMRRIAEESFRVLKPGRYYEILVGDAWRHRHHVPIAFRIIQAFLDIRFSIREYIIKCR